MSEWSFWSEEGAGIWTRVPLRGAIVFGWMETDANKPKSYTQHFVTVVNIYTVKP